MDKKLADVTKKLQIAKKVICAQDIKKGLTPETIFELYTGYEVSEDIRRKKCCYVDFFRIKNEGGQNLENLRKELVKFYLITKRPPTREDIENIPEYNDLFCKNVDQFYHFLAVNGFVWKSVTGTCKALFVERYDKIATRLKYLLKMRQHRESGRQIIYLDNITHRNHEGRKSFIAVSNKVGLVSLLKENENHEAGRFTEYFTTDETSDSQLHLTYEGAFKEYLATPPINIFWSLRHFPMSYRQFVSPKLTDQFVWIKNYVLNEVNEPSVFVLEEYPLSLWDMLGPYGAKQDMKEYLEEIGIPCGLRAHRFELFELIKRYSKEKLDKFSEFIMAHGHDVLLRPNKFNSLDFYRWFIESDVICKESFEIEKIKAAEEKLITSEYELLKQDRMMEEVIDKLMTMGKYEGVVSDHLTDYRDIVKYDLEHGTESMFAN